MIQKQSACPLDCPDLCSLEVTVDETTDRVVALDGTPGHERNPLTDGFICGKVRGFAEHMYGEARLRYPMLRDGARGSGAFRRVTWDEALGVVARNLARVRAQHGGEAILPYHYGGSNGWLTEECVDTRLFRRLGASRLLRTFCAAPSRSASRGLYGAVPGVALEDYVHAKLIVVWGCNPSATGIHLVPKINAALDEGATLVVVDPRRTPLARRAHLHLPLRPGTDLPVALAIIRELFARGAADEAFLATHATGADELRRRADAWTLERAAAIAGVEAELLGELVEVYAEASPAVIRCGWGPERNRNGGSAIAAVLAIPAVANKFGVRGGGFTMSNGDADWSVDPTAAIAEPAQPAPRTINMSQLGGVLEAQRDPAIHALFVYNCNPVATAPDQEAVRRGLRRDDLFTVVFDQVMTDTALLADVLLPATTFLEHRELRRGYGAMRMFDSAPVVAPVGEARPNYDVFVELIDRLGLARPGDPRTAGELVETILATSEQGRTIAGDLAAHGVASPPRGAAPLLFVDVLPGTPDGKVHLCPATLDAEAGGLYRYRDDPATEAYPLALISPAVSRAVSSTFGQLHRAQAAVELHPDDAAARGIGDGDAVRVWNDLGEVRCAARVSRDLRPGVALLPKGLWSHNTSNGNTANALVPETFADLGGGATYNDARVQIARV
jgi:anaerobic selenocysteine-containing dehydrogenase